MVDYMAPMLSIDHKMSTYHAMDHQVDKVRYHGLVKPVGTIR